MSTDMATEPDPRDGSPPRPRPGEAPAVSGLAALAEFLPEPLVLAPAAL
jgi:hypothetical protein